LVCDSRINRGIFDKIQPVNEPVISVGYPEQEFLIAEAISRGWVSGAGTAYEHYINGITASMQFYGIDNAAIATYLSTTTLSHLQKYAVEDASVSGWAFST